MNKYTLEDLPQLMKWNPYLYDTAMDMIEVALDDGNYQDVEINNEFVHKYLLEELNDGFIKLKVDTK